MVFIPEFLKSEVFIMKKYSLTIGLFDKDSEVQIWTCDAAQNIIASILIEDFNLFGCTIFPTTGAYKMQSTGNMVNEPSFRAEIVAKRIDYKAICAALKKELNQESIMVEIDGIFTKRIKFV